MNLQEVRAEIRRVLDLTIGVYRSRVGQREKFEKTRGERTPTLTTLSLESLDLLVLMRRAIEQAPPPEPAAADCPVCLKPTAVSVAAGQKPFGLCQCKNEPAPVAPVCSKCGSGFEPIYRAERWCLACQVADSQPAAPRPPSGDLSELRAALKAWNKPGAPMSLAAGNRLAAAVERHIAAAQAEQGEM